MNLHNSMNYAELTKLKAALISVNQWFYKKSVLSRFTSPVGGVILACIHLLASTGFIDQTLIVDSIA